MKSSKLLQNIGLGILLPLAIVGLGTGVFLGLGKSEPKQVSDLAQGLAGRLARLPIVQTQLSESFEGMGTVDLEANGVVVPYREITLAAEVAGRVSYKNEACEPGRYINAGDVLFRVDPRDYELEIDRTRRLYEQEQAQLREWQQELANVQRSLQLADEELQLQEQELKRLQSVKGGFVSQTELDQARRAKLASANQRQSFQNQADLLQTRRSRVELAQQLAATQLEQAKLNLARTEIKAPISGMIVREFAEADSYLKKGDTLCVIEDTQHIEVTCDLRMDQLIVLLDQQEQSRSGQPSPSRNEDARAAHYSLPPVPVSLHYHVAGRQDMTFEWTGHLSRYDGIGLDQQSRMIPCRIRVDDPRRYTINGQPPTKSPGGPQALVRGMFLDVNIHCQPNRPLMLVPKLALRPGNIIWKFVEDASVLQQGTVSPSKEPPLQAPAESLALAKLASVDQEHETGFDPEQWAAGRIAIIEGLKMVRPFTLPGKPNSRPKEFWLIEAHEAIVPGDALVVSPLANVSGVDTFVRASRRLGESN